MHVQIDQQFARLGLKIQNSQVQLKRTPPHTEVKTPDPKVEIQAQGGTFRVDTTRCREAIELYTPKVLGRRTAKQGMQELNNWIAEIAREGDQMARIEENGTNVIPQLAGKVFGDTKDVSLTTKPGPNVKFQKGQLNMDWKLRPINVNLRYGDVQSKANRAKVETYYQQKEYLDIGYDGRLIDFLK